MEFSHYEEGAHLAQKIIADKEKRQNINALKSLQHSGQRIILNKVQESYTFNRRVMRKIFA